MLPLIVRPALLELSGVMPGTPEFSRWVGLLFYVPALAGGVFGLLGGYLTDLFGRRRVLVWSILLYAFSALAAAFSTSPQMLLFFRCTTFVGVSVEFVAAVAWLAELFPNPEAPGGGPGRHPGLLVSRRPHGDRSVLPRGDLRGVAARRSWASHQAWRYTLMSGVIPALPLIAIRPFLPESPKWREKKAAGTLKRPSLAAIFQGDLRKTTLVTTLMFACSYGAAFGAIQHVPRMVPGLARGGRPGPARPGEGHQRGPGLAGVRGPHRPRPAGVPRRLRRVPTTPAADLPGAGPRPGAVRLLLCRHLGPPDAEVGDLPGRPAHGGAVQLLGELPAAGLPDPPAGDGGGVRRQRGRAG